MISSSQDSLFTNSCIELVFAVSIVKTKKEISGRLFAGSSTLKERDNKRSSV